MIAALAFRKTAVPLLAAAAFAFASSPLLAKDFQVLQPMADKPEKLPNGNYYVPSTPDTVRWGSLPNADAKPLLTVPSGSVVIFDTVSHEGILEDQGRNPTRYFSQFGIKPAQVLKDAQVITESSLQHDFVKDGPHIVTGPVGIEGAQAGDVLKVDILELQPRVPYGVISNRHGKGALPGEFPENKGPFPGADAAHPDLYGNVSTFTPIKEIGGKWYGIIKDKSGLEAHFPIKPFLGIMGVAVNTKEKPNSVPPGEYGGNLDLNELSAGSTLYLPVHVKGGLFFAADPHFVQGDGEVALTALEGSLRAKVRLTVLKAGDPALPMKAPMKQPFAETPNYWIPIGLNTDLNEAMKDATRQAVQFLNEKLGMDRATALAYLSAGTDFQVTEVVDKVKIINGMIRKSDFQKLEKR
ncbi:MAG: acetamidase/formamidase family protein [Betaproteobacteria bacterium]|nr:acetamidase/formamidase family protein [Betaproteobacteria bacterium]